MDNLANAFDLPVDSDEHRLLAETAWMGGNWVTVRYWLGRLSCRNLFRESNDTVRQSLQHFISGIGSVEGASLLSDPQAWSIATIILRHQLETLEGLKPTQNPRLVAALYALASDPALTISQLATIARTTEKQVARMSDVTYLRRLWERSQMRKA